MTAINTQNNLNVSAEDFDNKAFDEMVSNLRRTQKAAANVDKDRADLEAKLNENRVKVQEAIESDNYGDMQTYSSKCKQLAKKLEDMNPDVIRQDFNKSIDAFSDYFEAQNTDESSVLRAVGE